MGQYVELNRNRKIEELQKLDGQLQKIFTTKQANAESMRDIGSQCVNLLKYIKGTNDVLRNLKILKEQSLFIESSVNNSQPLSPELLPMIHTVVWSTKRLNLHQINEFNNLVMIYVDRQIILNVEQSPLVDMQLKNYFINLLPTPLETQGYLKDFCNRNNIDTNELYAVWPAESHVVLD